MEFGFTLLRPWWLLLLPLAGFIWLVVPVTRDVGMIWEKLISDHLKSVMLIRTDGKTPRYPWLPKALLIAGWCVAILALTGPSCSRMPASLTDKSTAQVIVVDLSASMLVQDLKPSRIQRVHFKIRDLIKRFPERHTGLVVYSGSAHSVLPITKDPDNLRNVIDNIVPQVMPLGGNRLDLALNKASELLINAGWGRGDIIVFTDGIEPLIEDNLDDWRDDNDAFQLAFFAVGTSEGGPIPIQDGVYLKDKRQQIIISQTDFSSIKSTASDLNGQFSPMTVDDSDIAALNLDDTRFDGKMEETEKESDQWQDQGYWLVLPLLAIALCAFRKGWAGAWLWPVLLIGGLNSPSVEANPSNAPPTTNQDSSEPLSLPDVAEPSLWISNDANAHRLLPQAPAKAAELFDDPEWKATAHYRAGNYFEAAKRFGELNTATGDYNQGNAFVQMQNYESAINSYQQALEKDPDHADAQHNLQIAKQRQQRQRQPLNIKIISLQN